MSGNNGSYKLLYIKSGEDYFPIGCLTENSFSETVEMLPSTTRQNTDGWGTSRPTGQSYSISFSGILSFDDRGGTVMTYSQLQTLKRAKTKIEWKIYSSLGGDTEAGYGYIVSLGNSASIDENVSFDGEITGFGMPSTTEGVPPGPYPDIVDMVPIYEAAKY